MEPFSAMMYTIGTGVVSGMLANPSDRQMCKIFGYLADRLRKGGEPVNHDLQRACAGRILRPRFSYANDVWRNSGFCRTCSAGM